MFDVSKWISFGSARVFITVILPSNVSFLCCQLFSIALTSLIFLVKFISVIQFKSSEKSIPKTLKFSWDQFSFIFGQIIWSEYFLFPIHTAFVLDEFIFKPYSKATSCVINNGHMSILFSLERGCRQGDLLPTSQYCLNLLDFFGKIYICNTV
jgi:hypothetical protein